MGGRSGGRPATRPQLDGGLKLDLYRLKRGGWIVPGASASGTLTWTNTRTAKPISSVGFASMLGEDGGWVRLRYTTTLWDGRQVASDYSIDLVAVPQPLGGRRLWFLCPATGARAAVLYMPAGHTRFASQAALRGSYRTQRIAPHERARELAQGIDIALGGSGNLIDWHPLKPPRMHWSTFGRKIAQAERARGKSIAALDRYIDRTRPAWRPGAVAGRS